MQMFEYKLLSVEAGGWWSSGGQVNYDELCQKLNELGREGWEVVNATDINRYYGQTSKVMIIMKRPLNNNQ